MTLDEISSNINRHQSLRKITSKDVHDDQSASIQPQPPPLAVQRMLKSATELGNIGEFRQRPPRVPRSSKTLTSQLRTRLPVNGININQHHRAHPDPTRPRHQHSHVNPSRRLSRNSSITSNISAYQYYPRSIRPRLDAGQHLPHEDQEQQYEYHNSNTMRSYRSLTSLRSHDRSRMNDSSSLKSFQPKHLYRERRPPISAASKTRGYYDSQPLQFRRHPKISTPTSSPNSLMSTGRSTQDYRNEYNHSARSFRDVPFPIYGARISKRPQRSSIRSTTPLFTLRQNEGLESTTSLASGLTSPTGSIMPFYYDYSESFHGNEALPQLGRNNPVTTQSPRHANETQSWSPRTATPVRHNCELGPIELPTKHNRRASEVSIRSQKGRRGKDGPHEELANDVLQVAHPNVLNSTDHCGQDSNTNPRNQFSPSNSTFFTNASRSPRNLSNLAARAHSPLSEDVLRSVRSIDGVTAESLTFKGDRHSIHIQEMGSAHSFDLPSFKFRPLSIGMSTDLRPRTSPVSATCHTPEIVSPRPERPTSSHSRKNFDRILGIEQSKDVNPNYILDLSANTTRSDRLERVDEASSPLKTPDPVVVSAMSTSKISRHKTYNNSGLTENNRWSGVTNHDKSTVESLLDKHIESLGLRPPAKEASTASTEPFQSMYLTDTSEDSELLKVTAAQTSQAIEAFHDTSLAHRPTSLTSSAQERLMPRRLFASTANDFPNFPLASSEPGIEPSSSSHENTIRASYGWFPLHSECNLEAGALGSRQTFLSGDYADVEDEKPTKMFKLRRHSSPDTTPVNARSPNQPLNTINDEISWNTPCRRARSHLISQENSQQRRKMKIRLKTQIDDPSSSPNDGNGIEDQKLQQYSHELVRMGLTRVPISAVNGFAELSGESANASQQSLSPSSERQQDVQPQTWSEMMAAMPVPISRTLGLRRKHSASTVRSDRSKNSVVSPVNTSRFTSTNFGRNISLRSPIPQLAEPDLGPKVSASDFDLAIGSPTTSPQTASTCVKADMYAISSRRQGQPTRPGWRFNSVRGIIPKSIEDATMSIRQATATNTKQKVMVSQDCRAPKTVSFAEEPVYSETVAMSDFAYRKHKIVEKLRGWCRRHCMRRPIVALKGRVSRVEGLLID